MAKLQPDVQEDVHPGHERSRKAASHGALPEFAEGDIVYMAREGHIAGDKLLLGWRGS